MQFSKATMTALAAQAEALGLPYKTIAEKIATGLAGAKSHGDKAKEERTTVWDGFKAAMTVALNEGHNHQALRVGLEVSCNNAGIPAGSFRGYISTIESLFSDVEAGKFTLEHASEISVKDARELYQSDDKKALQAARAKLAAATEGWNAENLSKLAELAATIAAPVVKEAKAKKAA